VYGAAVAICNVVLLCKCPTALVAAAVFSAVQLPNCFGGCCYLCSCAAQTENCQKVCSNEHAVCNVQCLSNLISRQTCFHALWEQCCRRWSTLVSDYISASLQQYRYVMQGPGGGLGEGGIAAVYPPGQRPHGQGLDPAFLAVQLRKLQKKQKGALRELQAAAGREAFWKHSAHSAEQALDQVTPWLSDDLSTTCVMAVSAAAFSSAYSRSCVYRRSTLLSRSNMRFITSE